MPRNKPYTAGLAVIDILLLLFTGGLWIFVMIVRELMRRS